ncbi:MAG: lysylphosphatidylglycerol synthase domain-containing protein [Gaiella sp.]
MAARADRDRRRSRRGGGNSLAPSPAATQTRVGATGVRGAQPCAGLARVSLLTGTGLGFKVAAVTAIAAAFGVERPLAAALVVVPAIELAAVLPVTPGNAGVASAAVAFALGAHGVEATTALAAGIAFGATEMLASIAVGAAGALILAGPVVRPALRRTAVGVLSASVSLAFAITVVLPAL